MLLLSIAADAHAHSSAKGVGDLFAGVLHALSSLEHLLPFAALGLLAGQQGERSESALLAFCLALMAGAGAALWMPVPSWVSLFNLFSAVVLGGLVAAAWRLPTAILYLVAIVFGLSHGLVNGAAMIGGGINPYLYIPGVGLAGLAVTAYGLIAVDYVLRHKVGWMQIAVRVAGSWVAAIGILVLAFSARTILAS